MSGAPPGSRRSSLRARQTQADEKRRLVLAVPDTDPEIWLELRRADFDTVAAHSDRVAKAKSIAAGVKANASIVATFCTAVLERDGSNEQPTADAPRRGLRSVDTEHPDDPPPTFADGRLGAVWEECEGMSATMCAVTVCDKAGVGKLASRLIDWSGLDPDERLEELRGE